ncbi:hypothetical protein BCF33_0733 [Hasllibacter halocynthiae]|uniref:Uncharacterized protein n=1 Tax=Hasllibacter halocynthiae TaxID=595589 RepID=A0A2T0X861_9RHOB|nr:hypothetical protein [Hasllibacter halocynthiae]PRY95119.1 hypothetical protein BCF33_0733 [Hasllibacter halocynthiae]
MRFAPLRLAALLVALAAPAAAYDITCDFPGPIPRPNGIIGNDCLAGQGLRCGEARGRLVVVDANGPSPRFLVEGRTYPVDRRVTTFGTTFNGWNRALGWDRPGELWIRPSGRARYIVRADVQGIATRADMNGFCEPAGFRIVRPAPPLFGH